MSDLAASRPRSATVLKTRLLDAHSDEFAAALAWAAEDPSLEAAAARITAARRRFVLGAATSFTYASLLAAKLSAALAKVTLVDGTIVRPLEILSDVHDSDVLIAISLRPYRRYTVEVAAPFVEAGGSLVLVTDSASAPLVPYAAEAVAIAARPPGDRRVRPAPPRDPGRAAGGGRAGHRHPHRAVERERQGRPAAARRA